MPAIGSCIGPGGALPPIVEGGNGTRTTPLSAIIPGVVFDLDATLAASYDGSGQYLRNLIASPADGALQSDYDFTLGSTSSAQTSDPSFHGSAGDAGAYFAHDVGDFFEINQASPGVPVFLNNLHKDQDFFFGAAFRMPDDDSGGTYATLMCNGATIGFKGVNVRIVTLAMPYVRLGQIGDSGGSQADSAAGALSYGSDALVIVSHSHSQNLTRFWINSTTAEEKPHSFNAGSIDTSRIATLGSGVSGTTPLNNGARSYGYFAGNHFLDDTGAIAIAHQLHIRHKRSYLP